MCILFENKDMLIVSSTKRVNKYSTYMSVYLLLTQLSRCDFDM